MLPTSTKVPFSYTPDGSDVTYLIQVPDRIGKMRFVRAMKATGAIVWNKAEIVASARALIAEAQLQEADQLTAIIDRYEGLSVETPKEESDRILAEWHDLSRILHAAGGNFAAIDADNSFWLELQPLIAARCFLIGIEGKPPIKRGPDGMVSDEALSEHIGNEVDIQLIGYRALALFNPSEAEAKNSESPQPSSSSQETSIAASERPTAPAGSSSENI